MLNGDDKSVWPDPASPCCIFTVSQGIAATVTAHQVWEIETEKATVRGGERKMGFFILILLFLGGGVSAQWKLKRPQSPFTCFPSWWWSVQRWHLVCYEYELFTCLVEKGKAMTVSTPASKWERGRAGARMRLHGSMTLGWLSVALVLIVAQGNYCSWGAGHPGPQEGYTGPLKPVVAWRSHKNYTS